jgi:hypothetical protein
MCNNYGSGLSKVVKLNLKCDKLNIKYCLYFMFLLILQFVIRTGIKFVGHLFYTIILTVPGPFPSTVLISPPAPLHTAVNRRV